MYYDCIFDTEEDEIDDGCSAGIYNCQSSPCKKTTSDVNASPIIGKSVYLGDASTAKNLDNLKKLGIRYVLNCASHDVDNHFPSDLVYENLHLQDKCCELLCIDTHLNKAHDFISQATASGHAVLVHCVAGVSRSAAIVIAYVMKHKKMTLVQAYQYVSKCRPCINPNIGFLKSLIQYEHYLYKQQQQPCNSPCDLQLNAVMSLAQLCFPTFDRKLIERTVAQYCTLDDIEVHNIEKELYKTYGG